MFSLLYYLFLTCTCLVLFVFPRLADSSSINRWKNIVIFAGQSNMSGRGGVVNDTWDSFIPLECRPNVSVLRLNRNLTWEEAHEPLHIDIDSEKICGVGPGMSFANAVLNQDPSFGIMGLVPCAIGGTYIGEWQRGTRLYKNLVKRANASLVDGGAIRALLWYQGESDTIDYQDALAYKGKLEKFFSDLRNDLQSPNLPIFQVALASGKGQYIETVRQAQLGTSLSNVVCVDAKGLELDADGLHLSTPAQVRLGEMLADAFLQTLHRTNSSINGNGLSGSPISPLNFLFRPLLVYLIVIVGFS